MTNLNERERIEPGTMGEDIVANTSDELGGLGHKLDQVDLEAAQDVGADPPGGLGTDVGGGSDEMGTVDQADQAGGTLE